jgi:integrase
MAKKLPPRLELREQVYYVNFWNGKRAVRSSLRTKNLLEAQTRFSGWLEARNNDIVHSDDPKFKFCIQHFMDQQVLAQEYNSANRYVAFQNNLNDYFGEKHISEITRKDGKNYVEQRSKGMIGNNRAASGTIKRELQTFRATLNFMRDKVEPKELRIKQEIIPYVDMPPDSPPRDRVLSQDELDRILTWKFNRVDRFVWLATYTAGRKTVLLNMKKSQVDLETKTIKLNPDGWAKTIKRNPTIPIDPKLYDYLIECFRIDETPKDVFYRNEKLGTETSEYVLGDFPKNIDGDLNRLLMQNQIHNVSAHTFRHTWATHKVSKGIPIDKVAKFMGDTEKTVRENYEHLSPDYLRDVF